MPGSSVGDGTMVGVQSVVLAFSSLNRGSIWVGSPAFCLDPGEEVSTKKLADGSFVRHEGTRWQFAQQQLEKQSNSLVLSSKSFVRMRTVREHKGTSGSDNKEDPESELKLSRNATVSESAIPFSQAVMVVEQLQRIRGNPVTYILLTLMVPFLFVPILLYLALLGPCLILDGQYAVVQRRAKFVPLVAVIFAAVMALLLLVFKWLLAGRFKPASFSLHGRWIVLRTMELYILHTFSSVLFLDAMMGTRWAAWYLSALGAKIGKDVYLESLPLFEADLLTLGDGVVMDQFARTVPYTVENGCLDYLEVKVAKNATLGPRAYVLPSAALESNSGVGPLSVVLKGDVVLKGTYAEGSPLVHIGTWYDPRAPKPEGDSERLALLRKMEHDANLPVAIQMPAVRTVLGSSMPDSVRQGPPKVAFLTGATGFVGGFILRELLQRHVNKVYCLIRCSSEKNGIERMKKQLLHHDLCTETTWQQEFAPRIKVLQGDLGAPSIGLSDELLEHLADEVDVIINNGAYVNITKGYETMKAANIDSVLTLLKMSVSGRAPTPLHQISTGGTLPRENKTFYEDYDNSDPSHLYSGYDQTKWVAEQLIDRATKKGIPAAVYRLGRIGGDSTSGCANENDYCMLTIKGCLQLGCFPKDFSFDLNIIPGDLAAKIIVERAMNPASVGRVYHVTNPKPKPFSHAVKTLRDMGYVFEEVAYVAWQERLLNLASEDNALKPLEGTFGRYRPTLSMPLNCRNAGIRGDTLLPGQLRRDFEWCERVGFFPPLRRS